MFYKVENCFFCFMDSEMQLQETWSVHSMQKCGNKLGEN